MLEKTFEDFLFASLPDKSRTCPRLEFWFCVPPMEFKDRVLEHFFCFKGSVFFSFREHYKK